ncbi:MAG: glycosyltransferase, partial [Solirubrobacterales bacterium]
IVPTRDRPQRLRRCLEAIAGLDYPRGRLEVLVVDDAGAESLEEVVKPLLDRLDLHLLTGAGRGPAAARNAGIAAAAGELLAFTDDDCEPEHGWLATLVRAAAGRERLAGGRTVNALKANRFAAASQAITDSVYAHYNAMPERAGFLTANNLAGPATAFQRLGGFDERFSLAAGEDRDLCSRWLEQGGELVYEPTAVVRHAHELHTLDFWCQHYGYGRGTYLQRRLRAERGAGFELAPAATSGILSAAARKALAEHKPSRLALLGVWQLANAAGFARQALTRKS